MNRRLPFKKILNKKIFIIFLCIFPVKATYSKLIIRHFEKLPPPTIRINPDIKQIDSLKKINEIIKQFISPDDLNQGGAYAGAVILAWHENKTLYQGIFGSRQVKAETIQSMGNKETRVYINKKPIREDSIFDLASLTKIIVTTTSIMQLEENKLINLDSPISHYWPDFKGSGKEKITIRQVLTHTSGLPSSISYNDLLNIKQSQKPWLDQMLTCIKKIEKEKDYYKRRIYINKIKKSQEKMKITVLNHIKNIAIQYSPGKKFEYSDIGYIILGHLITLITKQPLDEYARQKIFKPLNMNNTDFSPSAYLLYDHMTPTASVEDGTLRLGLVNDPTAALMGGIAGSAGLFSTAPDIMKFLQCLLRGGSIASELQSNPQKNKYLLRPETIKKMISPQFQDGDIKRGLGWDIYSSPELSSWKGGQENYLSSYAVGHTGWTGTSIALDPERKLAIIILTSRTYPDLQGIIKDKSKKENKQVLTEGTLQTKKQVQKTREQVTKQIASSIQSNTEPKSELQ